MGKLKDSRGHPFIYLYETQVRKESREGKESAAKGSNDVDPENLVVPFLSAFLRVYFFRLLFYPLPDLSKATSHRFVLDDRCTRLR